MLFSRNYYFAAAGLFLFIWLSTYDVHAQAAIYYADNYCSLKSNTYRGYNGNFYVHYQSGYYANLSIYNKEGQFVVSVKPEKSKLIKSCKIWDVVLFDNKIMVIASGKNDAVPKGHTGIFAWEYIPALGTFSEPELIESLQEKSLSNLVIAISENGKYMGFVADFIVLSEDICQYSVSVINHDLKRVYAHNKVKLIMSDVVKQRNLFIDNQGGLYIVADQSYGAYDLTSYMQRPSEYGAYISYQSNGVLDLQESSETRKWAPLGAELVEFNNSPQFIYFWHAPDTNFLVNMSQFDPVSKTHTRLYTFDATWLQPYFKMLARETNYDEREEDTKLGNSSVNILFDILCTIETEDKHRTFVIQKYYPLMFVHGNGQSAEKTYHNYAGDILILEFDEKNQLVAKSKIERSVHAEYTSKGVHCRLRDDKLMLLYYSKDLSGITADSHISETNLQKRPDLNMYYSMYNLTDKTISTELTTVFGFGSGNPLIVPQLDQAQDAEKGIYFYTKTLKTQDLVNKSYIIGSSYQMEFVELSEFE